VNSALRDWLVNPIPGRGVHVLSEDGTTWGFREYPEIASSARRVATALRRDGVRPGDVVAVLMPTGFPCLSAFFGVWAAGATPCMITPPTFDDEDGYAARIGGILAQAAPALVVTSPELANTARHALRAAGRPDDPWSWREADDESDLIAPDGPALLQFTSGSTATPRGVPVGWDHLAANIGLIRNWLHWRDDDATASWLPLYHDMGLIGCLLTPVVSQCDLHVMRPAQFIRDPERWLRCLAIAAHTAAPPFAFEYTARRVSAERFADLDLSGWRNAIVGAEPVDAAALERFAQLAEPAGFSRSTFLPAYGLAEATLAVTAATGPRAPRVVRPEPDSLRFGEPVRIVAEYLLGDVADPGSAGWLTGCGGPSSGVSVDVVDKDGRSLPEGCLGEIVVEGPSVADGYHAGAVGGTTRFSAGRLKTADAGFLYQGELFVLGRMGDSLKLRGRSVYMEDLEATVAEAAGLQRTKCAVVNMSSVDRPGVALFAEVPRGEWETAARRALRAVLGSAAEIVVVTGRPGLISRTSSGKPRRRRMWAALRSGRFGDFRRDKGDRAGEPLSEPLEKNRS
jgi:fatty-acyl-CoA synthase